MVMGDDPGHQAPVMTPDQFAAFMEAQARQTERLLAAAREGAPAGAQGGAGAAVAVGQLQPCLLGKDKTKRYTRWTNWLKDATTKMAYLNITSNSQKLAYVKSQAGAELLTLWEKEVRARWVGVPANDELGREAQEAHTYKELITETERVLLEIINRDRAVIDLLKITQGNRTVMEFLAEIEDQVKLTRADKQRITEDDLVRMALIAGFRDRSLAEKVLAEKYSLKTTVELAVTRENSKANARAMQGKGEAEVRRLGRRSKSEHLAAGDSDSSSQAGESGRLEELQRQLDVLKIQKHGKYSGKYTKEEDKGSSTSAKRCRNCDLPHEAGDCRAAGKPCYQCQGVGHYARAPACPARRNGGRKRGVRRSASAAATNRRVAEEYESSDSGTSDSCMPVSKLSTALAEKQRQWPGVQENPNISRLFKVEEEEQGKSTRRSRWVTVRLQGVRRRLFVDTGCRYTLIPPELYRREMGELVPAKRTLRAWGARDELDVKGMFRTTITTSKGATSRSWVYVVAGHRPEPLLGDKDAERLGIIAFRPEGREPTKEERSSKVRKVRSKEPGAGSREEASSSGGRTRERRASSSSGDSSRSPDLALRSCSIPQEHTRSDGCSDRMMISTPDSPTLQDSEQWTARRSRTGLAAAGSGSRTATIPGKLRSAGVTVNTGRDKLPRIDPKEKARAWGIVNAHRASVFRPGVGKIKMEPVVLEHEQGFRPVQPPRRPVPYHYRERLSQHLAMMRREGVIEDVDPREPIDAVLNLVITDKKAPGEIRMNVDATPINVGAKMTKYHVKTAAEVRHELEGAAYFSELDMGFGFHQIPLSTITSTKLAVFQSHEGLHRMKRLFFGPKASSGIFHNIVQGCFRGVEGVTTIHDNILVYGATPAQHHTNLSNCLQRAKERGVRLKLEKSTIFENKVNWFGRVFSATGVSASPDKINNICQAGRPDTVEEVRSLLQACAFNAKFAFDHSEGRSYSEITAPLREMLGKEGNYKWTEERESSYQELIRTMSSETTLRPFNSKRPIHFVSDASPKGIAASVYQETAGGSWVPVDHVDRALSAVEQGWSSQIEWEALGKAWGMRMLRSYLVGQHFTSWGDHRPLTSIFNNPSTPTSIRIDALRKKVQDLDFTDKYLAGKANPCDYRSRKPTSIEDLPEAEHEKLGVDNNTDVLVMKVVMDDMPPAMELDRVKEAAELDTKYQQLLRAVRQGRRPSNPALASYTHVWPELAVVDGLLLRGERLVVPDANLGDECGTLRQWCVELAHEGHQGAPGTKRLLRTRLWWPGMDKLVEARVESCLPCQAAAPAHHRDPLQPTTAPSRPMEYQSGDHWGPTPDGKYVLVVMDLLTRFPEVMVVSNTSAEANIHALDSMFSRHSPPKLFLTDNGPPWNTSPSHPLQQYFKKMGIQHKTTRSADDPEANGVCEAFMKHLKKVWHTSIIEGRDPKLELNKHLRAFRATPHPTTGAAPGDLLYGSNFRTKLPDLRPNKADTRQDLLDARKKDAEEKAKMKGHKDKGRHVKPHSIRVGDTVLKDQKQTKSKPPFDPEHFIVTEVHGTQVQAKRGEEVRRRDAQKWKKVDCRAPPNFTRRSPREQFQEADIGPPQATPQAPPAAGARASEGRARAARAPSPPADDGGAQDLPFAPAPQDPPPAPQEDAAAPDPPAPAAGGEAQGAAQGPLLPALAANPAVILHTTPANRPRRATAGQRTEPLYTPTATIRNRKAPKRGQKL